MALTTKTIEYAMPMVGVTSEGTTFNDSADKTIYIPETTSRTFKSVTIECTFAEALATAVNVTAYRARGSCNGGTNWTNCPSSAAIGTQTQSGENQSLILVGDVTSEFTSRFGSGSTGTFRWGWYVDMASTGNVGMVSCKLIITYEADVASHSTRIKTVRIPIESLNNRLSNTAQIVRQGSITNQIPALDTFLPESSKTYRQIFMELWTNTLPSSTGTPELTLKIDSGGSETGFGVMAGALATPILVRVLYDISSITTNAAHDLYARHTVASQSIFAHIGGWVTVTYEYDHTNSTSIMNSLVLSLGDNTLPVRVSGDDNQNYVKRVISEPATVTLAQSGCFFMTQTGTTSGTLSFGMGSQTKTGYTPTAATGMAGMLTFMHRVDSGGYRGAGLTLARGSNTFSVGWYASADNIFANCSCMLILNYTSGKFSGTNGADAHSRTTHWCLAQSSTGTTTNIKITPTRTPEIPESNYWLVGVVPIIYTFGQTGATYYGTWQFEYQSGEEAGAGWADVFTSIGVANNERCWTVNTTIGRSFFKRHPNDLDTDRADIETSRDWRYYGLSTFYALGMWVSYHAMTFTVSGTLSGYTGDGSGITVALHRSDTGELMATTTTATGGSYSFTWYDNSINLFTQALQNSTHMGRSDDDVAS